MLNCGLLLTVVLVVLLAQYVISLKCREPVYEYDNLCTIENYNNSFPSDVQLSSAFDHENIENLRFSKSIINDFMKNDLLKLFPNLKTLDVSNCSINGIFIKSPTKLQHLNVSNNNLKRINRNTFWAAIHLTTIDLSYNRIEYIDSLAFKNCLAMDTVNFSHNRIQSLSENFILTSKELDLSFNGITYILFSDKINIQRVNLNNNKLSDLQVNEYLEKLSLAHNNLASLQFLDVKNSLAELDLSFNPLNHSESNSNLKVLTTLTNLKVLILKSTYLNYTNFTIFSGLEELEELDISSNNLKFIEFNLSHRSENLKHFFLNSKLIDISENNFQCSDLRTILKKLKQLNIEVSKLNNDKLNTTNIINNKIQCNIGSNIKKRMVSEQTKTTNEIHQNCTSTIHNLLEKYNHLRKKNLFYGAVTFVIIILMIFYGIIKLCTMRSKVKPVAVHSSPTSDPVIENNMYISPNKDPVYNHEYEVVIYSDEDHYNKLEYK